MQETSALYKRLFSGAHRVETRVAIGESGVLVNESGDFITFGKTRILVARSGADSGYGENVLVHVSTSRQVFSDDKPQVGCCTAGEISITMLRPKGDIPRMAQIVPYIRLTNGNEYSEWIQKGVYYIDTREYNNDDSGVDTITLHGYDAMLKAEMDYTGNALSWPSTDVQVVKDIARLMDVQVDSETLSILTKKYPVQLPSGYSCREVLGYIAAMYAGNFIMSDAGDLKLLQLNGLPAETRYLVDHGGYYLVFGSAANATRIKV